ncbi:ABC transporter permease [Agromyces aerolatus]|uniref:ABC transporter permease n=1 Tax=Agromyces sp. LY-1074 TaxID=3074080 RepID=UPI00285A46A0|nr:MULTISPECIES: ABC transporter permease subunit [unclassified Agromyces]MDR5701911.1 ABC transporter permease subunit [Agromyces sp. LY-1074]MDR5708121.1 ABC transporter permease subunit [Agromyces sp. LY-1358]
MASQPVRPSERVFSVLTGIAIGAIIVIVLAPAVLAVVLSFSTDSAISFPPKSWGFDRYVSFFTSPQWTDPLFLSIRLALMSALVALVVGLATLIAVHRSRLPFRGGIETLSLVSLVLPVSAYAVAMFVVYSATGLRGSEIGIVLMYAMLGLPMVVLIGGTAIRQLNGDVELVANVLGASKFRAWGGLTLPMLAPAFVASFAAAFQLAFEEAVFIDFLGGPGLKTLPKAISDSVRYGSDPVITAIAATLVIITTIFVAIPLGVARGRKHD